MGVYFKKFLALVRLHLPDRIFNLLSLKRIINFKSQSEGLDGTVTAFLPVILKVLGSSPLQDEERLRLLCFKEPRQ